MPVRQVAQRMQLEPNHVYVIPPDRQLLLADDHIAASAFDEPRGQRAPIDQFFRSLAAQHGDGFAVVLSGAGSDGAVGIKAVKENGGITLVQDPNEAEYASMPQSAIASGCADFVLPIRDLVRQIVDLSRGKEQLRRPDIDGEEEALRRIPSHVRVRTGHDFSKYKRATVMRRLLRRLQVTRKETLEDYLNYLRETADEVQALFADLLISVTNFFRDGAAFDQLAKRVIPQIF